jgi:phosphatidylserine decarboxylase
MIAKDGIPVIIGTGIIVMVIAGLTYTLNSLVLGILTFLLGTIFIFHFFFFRDPDRKTPAGDNLIIAPADGTIIKIDEVEENEYFNEKVKRVSIFMSVFNVHVNRIPLAGEIEYLDYAKGRFKAAFAQDAPEVNERTVIGIRSEKGKLMFKQIAGLIARRIVYRIKTGDMVKSGERFGLIKYGSRVDLYFPLSVKLNVKLKDKVKSGSTIIGEF